MKTITINDMPFIIPEAYNELTPRQLRAVGKLIAFSNADAQLNAIYALLDIRVLRWKDRKKRKVISRLGGEWLHTLLTNNTIFGWLFGKAKLINYPIRSFWMRGIKYHGPHGDILNTNASEVVFAYTFFKQYSKTQKAEYLDRIVALLYRPYNPMSLIKRFTYGYTGDVRMPLNGYFFEKRVKRVAKLSADVKSIIFLQWASAWESFQDRDSLKLVFPKIEADPNAKEDPYVWEKLMMRMAESQVFGSYKEVELMEKDRFFMNMARNIEEYLAIKDARKK
jgi:hypothetical protein